MRQGKFVDTTISFTSMAGYSAPIFWVALLMIMVFSLHFEMFPVGGRYDLLYEIEHVTGFAMIDAFLLKDATEHMRCKVLSNTWHCLVSF